MRLTPAILLKSSLKTSSQQRLIHVESPLPQQGSTQLGVPDPPVISPERVIL